MRFPKFSGQISSKDLPLTEGVDIWEAIQKKAEYIAKNLN